MKILVTFLLLTCVSFSFGQTHKDYEDSMTYESYPSNKNNKCIKTAFPRFYKPWVGVDELIAQLRLPERRKSDLDLAIFYARKGFPFYTADYLPDNAAKSEKAIALMLAFEMLAARKSEFALHWCDANGRDLGYSAQAEEAEKIADRLRAIAISP